ncbi:unnamed protein product, partial [Rotaria sp. Silwood2]
TRRNSQQSMTMIEQNTSSIHQLQHGNQQSYIGNHVGPMLSDQSLPIINASMPTEVPQQQTIC